MKLQKTTLSIRIKAIISLFCLLISAQTMPLQRAQTFLTPEQRRYLAARQAVFRQKIRAQALSATEASVWIRTNDNEVMMLPQWKIDETETLKSLFSSQKDKNSQTNPIDASMLTKAELELLSTALDKIAAGQFDQYYASLEPEYKKSLTDKSVGPGQLRNLISLAGKVKAHTLSAFLGSYFLPTDMQKHLMVPQIINPVVDYLKNEILKKNILHTTILAGHQGKLVNVEFSKDGKVAVTSSEGERDNLITWDGQTGKKLKTFTVTQGDIKFVAINNDGSKILINATQNSLNMQEFFNASDDNDQNKQPNSPEKEILVLWDAKTGRPIKILDNLPDTNVNNAQFSSDGQRIVAAVGHDDNQQNEEKAYILIADSATGNTIATHEIKQNYPDFTLNPSGNTVLVRSEMNLILYDLGTGKEIKKLDGPTERIYNASYSTDGTKIIAYGFTAQTIFIWNGRTGEQITQFNNIILSKIELNSDGTKMLTVSPGTTDVISVRDVATQTVLHTLDGQQSQISSMRFSPDSTMIVSAGQGDKNIIVWDAITGEQLRTLDHPSNFTEVEFSSDGKRIQSHSSPTEVEEKCTIKLWNTRTGKEIHTFIADHNLLEMDSNFLNIIGPDDANNRNCILWTSFSDKERATFAKIENNLNLSQAHFLYQLYMAKLSNTPLLFDTRQEFQGLPTDIQTMVTMYLRSSLPKVSLPQPSALSQPASAPVQQPAIVIPQQKTLTTPVQVPTPKAQTWWQLMTGR